MAALALASSCQDEGGLNPPEQDRTVTISAVQTKSALDGNAVKWENGDKISLVFTHSTKATVVEAFSTSIDGAATASADFTGVLPLEVYREDSGYDPEVFSVYPHDAVNASGVLDFTLPAEQRIRSNGTFASGLNLSSAAVSLADIQDDGDASASFKNALSILRFAVSDDVTSVTLSGTSPLAGKAPISSFVLSEGEDFGRLVIDDGEWTNASNSVTLLPAEGSECFPGGEVNMLVWPGTHTAMSVTVNYKAYGDYSKSKTFDFEFLPSHYYTLDLNVDSDDFITDITDRIVAMENDLADLENRLAALDDTADKISLLVNQIQSLTLVTEHLDNAVYAYYAPASVGYTEKPITLDYVVRPAKAMELLLEICSDEGNLSEVLSAKLTYGGWGFYGLPVTDAALDGDVLTVKADASGIDKAFYDGNQPASVALEIKDGNTEILSDFANLVPKKGLALAVAKSNNIPVLRGSRLSFQFDYSALNIANVTAAIEDVRGFTEQPGVSLGSYVGHVSAWFGATDDISAMSFKVVLKDNQTQETDFVEFTFEDVGEFKVDYTAGVDYLGGEVMVEFYAPQNKYEYKDAQMHLEGNSKTAVAYSYIPGGAKDYVDVYYDYYTWVYEGVVGVPGFYTVEPNVEVVLTKKDHRDDEVEYTTTINSGQESRSFNVVIKVSTTDDKYSYTKGVTILQKENGAPIDESLYYPNLYSELLQEAIPSYRYDNPLNIVVLGDGYQKKDLLKGGKFARNARSACNAFFAVEPFKSFQDRFNVYMVACESEDSGPRIGSAQNGHNTYFGLYRNNDSGTYVNYTSPDHIVNIVKNTLGLTGSDYYRTVVIVLVNEESLQLGSTNYVEQTTVSGANDPGDGYATVPIAMLSTYSMTMNGLVRHEAAGHGFGRLGDEYDVNWYNASLVNERHGVGFYFNIATNNSYWSNFTAAGYGADKVTYDAYCGGSLYRSTHESGIMWNNNGYFNAVSRHAIYQRIIKQTEGSSAYSWAKFLEYDKKNIQ